MNSSSMFAQGHTREAGGRMLAFNMGLLKLESAMNEVFLQTVG